MPRNNRPSTSAPVVSRGCSVLRSTVSSLMMWSPDDVESKLSCARTLPSGSWRFRTITGRWQ